MLLQFQKKNYLFGSEDSLKLLFYDPSKAIRLEEGKNIEQKNPKLRNNNNKFLCFYYTTLPKSESLGFQIFCCTLFSAIQSCIRFTFGILTADGSTNLFILPPENSSNKKFFSFFHFIERFNSTLFL